MKKKLLLAMAAIFLMSGNIHAQQPVIPDLNTSNAVSLTASAFASKSFVDYPLADEKLIRKTKEHWRKLRNNGIVLTSLGTACIITGAALIHADANSYSDDADGVRAVVGVLGIAGGITSLGGGITMWAIGNNRLRKIQQFSLRTNGSSMGVVYRF